MRSLANNPIVTNRPATTPLPLSSGLSQGPAQGSSPSTSSVPHHHTHAPELNQHQPQQQARQAGPIVSALPSHAAPLKPGMSGANTTITSANNNHPHRESFSYGQPAHRTTTNSTTTTNAAAGAPTTGGGTRRSFDAVPQVLPPRPPRTWHPDNFDPFATPVQIAASVPAPAPTTTSTGADCTAPRLFQIPSNTSYYETPSILPPAAAVQPSYVLQENNPPNSLLPPPSISSSSFCPTTTHSLEELFAQVDPQVGCAGNSVPLVQQRTSHHHHHHLDHLQQAQRFRDQDPFAAPPGFV
ncbi:hypothetical protein FRC01_007233 [Tulasnella sp. 417]|nr:hypothetical protein FRC01_007233 [Tulasnella sp. 417]